MSEHPDRRGFIRQSLGGMVGLAVGLGGSSMLLRGPAHAVQQNAGGSHEPFAGIFPIVQTPFRADESIDLEDLVREINFIIEAGGHGLVWPQNASEFQVLTDAERYEVAELMVREARGRRPVIIGVQSTNFWRTALDLATHAETIGADGIIALPPYQTSPSVEEAAEFYRAVARSVSLPMFIQNSGGAQGPALPVDTMVELATEQPTIAYIKEEASPVLERITELTEKGQGRIKGVFSGAGGTRLIEELNNGSRGSCPSAGMIDVFARVFDLYEAGETQAAEQLFAGLRPMFSFRSGGMHWLFKEKAILQRRGIIKSANTRIAGDLVWPSAEAEAGFNDAFAAIEPHFTWTGA